MASRLILVAAFAACLTGLAGDPAALAQGTAAPSVRYVSLDSAAGTAQAVIVQGCPLVHTRQLLPLNREGKLVSEDSEAKQIEQVLANLEAVLGAAGSGMDKLVRVNVYAMSQQAASHLREALNKRVDAAVRPVVTSVLTPLLNRQALVAIDAVAVSSENVSTVTYRCCDSVSRYGFCADAAILPRGGVVYLSGHPVKDASIDVAACTSMSYLLLALKELKLSPSDVVQVKVFLKPVTSAYPVLHDLRAQFMDLTPGFGEKKYKKGSEPAIMPPLVFVEWIATAPVEIELIAALPPAASAVQTVEYCNPLGAKPSPDFSRAALVRSDRRVYLTGMSAKAVGSPEDEARCVFGQLKAILGATDCDLTHLVKASYYVSDDDASKMFNKVRSEFFDPQRPPAASKVTVHGVGASKRTITMDMIAVGSGK